VEETGDASTENFPVSRQEHVSLKRRCRQNPTAASLKRAAVALKALRVKAYPRLRPSLRLTNPNPSKATAISGSVAGSGLAGEALEVRIAHPTLAQAFVGQAVDVLEQQ